MGGEGGGSWYSWRPQSGQTTTSDLPFFIRKEEGPIVAAWYMSQRHDRYCKPTHNAQFFTTEHTTSAGPLHVRLTSSQE